MHIIIVSTNQADTANQLQIQLNSLRGTLLPKDSLVFSIYEDWPEGAGNGLGTLYAFQKASELAISEHGVNLLDSLKEGSTAILYHTAGKGKRLAPLVFAERNQKSSVKLPSRILQNQNTISILEAVIYQTLSFSSSLAGRLSVFWGDQIFIPDRFISPPEAVNIFSRQQGSIDLKTFEERGLKNYGILGIQSNQVCLLDKIQFETFKKLQKELLFQKFAISLGSFSISPEMLSALLKEFCKELSQKKGTLDTDPHFWMPMTLNEKTYVDLMKERGVNLDNSKSHWQRIQSFLDHFKKSNQIPLFGISEVNGYWWDFGTVKPYFQNLMKLTHDSEEGEALRRFLKIELTEGKNVLLGSRIGTSKIEHSILVNVEANQIESTGCMILNSNLNRMKGKDSLLYCVNDRSELVLTPKTVRTDVRKKNEWIPVCTTLDANGKADWQVRIPSNRHSYAEIFEIVSNV